MTEQNSAAPEPTLELVLHIAVPGVWMDDINEMVPEYYDDPVGYVLDPDGMGLDPRVHITVITTGDESGPIVHSYDCRVVGADVRSRV